ncbi:hypothetical protein GEMRC1_002405 [Eukaryota sp. GEM-RC1]
MKKRKKKTLNKTTFSSPRLSPRKVYSLPLLSPKRPNTPMVVKPLPPKLKRTELRKIFFRNFLPSEMEVPECTVISTDEVDEIRDGKLLVSNNGVVKKDTNVTSLNENTPRFEVSLFKAIKKR